MAVIEKFSTIIEMFDKVTYRFQDDQRPMLMHKIEGKYQGLGYREIKNKVDNFALGLAAIGVTRGTNIAIISENRPEWVIADMGMMKLGAVSVALYPTLTPKQIEYILIDSCAKYAIVSNQLQLNKLLKVIDDIPLLETVILMSDDSNINDDRIYPFSKVIGMSSDFRENNVEYLQHEMNKVKPEDLLTIIYTSGTTGNPKGVMLSHKNLVSNIIASAECIIFNHEDTVLSFLPLSHSYERMAGYYTAIACGATIAYAESIDTVRENLLEVQPTIVTTVPRLFERIYNRLMKQMSDEPKIRQKIFSWALGVGRTYACARKNKITSPSLSARYKLADKFVFQKIKARTGGKIKFFASGGAALASELGEFFEAIGIKIIEGYGMTESSPVISVNRLDDYKWGTVGKPIPDVVVKIAEDGEILVKGPNVMIGYWKNPKATEEIIDNDGWLHTGDIGMFDTEGYLKITDRKKHLFVSSGGKNIAPQHIENLFLQSQFIDQFVLIGDGKMYLSALIVPNFDVVKEYASKQHIPFQSVEDLTTHQEIYKLLEIELNKIQSDLANYERVRKFTILDRPLTIENGEITPTLKPRRKFIEEKFREIIDKMYAGVN